MVAKLSQNRFAGFLYSRAAFPLMRRIAGVNPLVVYYHLVSDDEVPHVSNLYAFRTVAQFKRDMDVVLRFYRALSLVDFMRSLKGQQALPKDSFLLTFDDGLRECYEVVAPILKQKGIPATFFLCSSFVDNKELAYDFKKSLLAGALKTQSLSKAQHEQVRALLEGAGIGHPDIVAGVLSADYRQRMVLDAIAERLSYDFSFYLKTAQPYLTSVQVGELVMAGHGIGAHSIDHPRYEDIPLREQLRQTRESIKFVKEQFEIGYGAFAFPSSDANVSTGFFREILGRGVADVCFGNHGLLKDSVPHNVQRSSMERTDMPAEAILGRNYARRVARMMAGRLEIRRP
jgi:peptidoglycan/xylan/chitin deacetylase (PgdA/CDA1 family)